MQKLNFIFIVVIVSLSFLGMSYSSSDFKDVLYEKILYGYSPSIPLWDRYKIPHDLSMKGNINLNEQGKHIQTPLTTREKYYDSLEYPRFEYPFMREKYKDVRVLGGYRYSPMNDYKNERYWGYSSITIYQPEFQMLKRYYSPRKFIYTLIPTPPSNPDSGASYSGSKLFWYEYSIEQAITGSCQQEPPITPGYPQGFYEGLSYTKFNAYIAKNKFDTFVIVIPKNVKVNKVKEFNQIGVLFIGTTTYKDPNKDYDGFTFDIIDVVVLYDRRLVEYIHF